MSITYEQPDLDRVDARGPRFAAWVTTAVLIAALAASGFSTTAAAVILAAQAAVFAIGALRGPRHHPYGRLFAAFVGGAPLVAVIATATALAAAFLNAAFGICLGCQAYPLAARLRRRQAAN